MRKCQEGLGCKVIIFADVRAWLLSNPDLEDPLDVWVYCHRRYAAERVPTRPLRWHNYLPENAIANWPRQQGARTGIQVPQKDVRADPSPANG